MPAQGADMAYDETLAGRLRDLFAELPGVTDKRMFGGLAFLGDGHLTVCVMGDDLMVRVGADAAAEALTRPGTRRFELTRRPMRGWVVVDGAVLDDDVLAEWVNRARAFVATLPPKDPAAPRK
ncbi:TfoX/Sxy family protein [Actinoplanes sp. NPDC049316]|uniref:TfoX/Sxy family protein n=1 Tax=Actinoplanes sp. NPDC049316 TaxID=3154727 RepID=UPI003432554A